MKSMLTVIILVCFLPLGGQQTIMRAEPDQAKNSGDSKPALHDAQIAECVIEHNGTTIKCTWPKDQSKTYLQRFISPENAANLALVVVGLGGVIAALCTLRIINKQAREAKLQRIATHNTLIAIKRQADLMEMQADYMVNSERPFIIIETRGDKGEEFWMRNCGKSPAQILFFDPLLLTQFPAWVQAKGEWDLPGRPEYGPHYWDDQWEQINVQWLGPGDSKCFASFDPQSVSMLPEDMRLEITAGHRAVRVYSSIKYRGMFGPQIYHSRFCYGWGPFGTFMTGPHGYNKYT